MSLSVPARTLDSAALPPRDGPAAAAPRGRASWSGLLRLSLVAVPVKAYPAISTTPAYRCHQLHAGCGQRIRYEKHCPVHGQVDAGAIVSGYPYAPDQYVVIDDDQLDQLRAAPDRALCLERFLDAEQFDPALFSGRSISARSVARSAADHLAGLVSEAAEMTPSVSSASWICCLVIMAFPFSVTAHGIGLVIPLCGPRECTAPSLAFRPAKFARRTLETSPRMRGAARRPGSVCRPPQPRRSP